MSDGNFTEQLETPDNSKDELHQLGDFMLLLCFYLTPVLVIFGLFGNTLAYSIFKRGMKRSASHFYFCVLSIADSCTLISVFLVGAWFRIYLPEWMALESLAQNTTTNFSAAVSEGYSGVLTYIIFTLHRSPGCSIWYFIRLTSQTASVWLLVAFTFTRMMVIRHPLNGIRYTTVSSARVFALVVVIASAALNLGVAIHDDCERRNGVDFDEIIELAFISFIPSILLLTMNCLILTSVYRRHDESRSLRKDSRSELAKLDAEKSKLSGITQRLLAVSICFILLEAPSFSFKLFTMVRNEAQPLSPHTWISIDATLRFLSIVNFSVNFILYCLTGRQFRNAFLSMLRCKSPTSVLSSVRKPYCGSAASTAMTQSYTTDRCKERRNNAGTKLLAHCKEKSKYVNFMQTQIIIDHACVKHHKHHQNVVQNEVSTELQPLRASNGSLKGSCDNSSVCCSQNRRSSV